MILGIDLGTTNSAIAFIDEDSGPFLIPNAFNSPLTPSVVGFDLSDELLVGQAAKELQILHPERCASVFKRLMGTEETVKILSKEYKPETLSAMILSSLKSDAEAFLGHAISEVVITVPAYFNNEQRQATLRAGEIAGLKVRRIINEPTAAAIAYGFHDSKDEKIIAVFDLGGGTFDVSIVDFFDGIVEIQASSGEAFLGGEDFTVAIAKDILKANNLSFEAVEFKHPKMLSRLISQCERAKIKLSDEDSYTFTMPDLNGNNSEDEVTLTKEQIQASTEPILKKLKKPIVTSLGDAELSYSDVDEVILVGGACFMPLIKDYVEKIFKQTPHNRLNPNYVVAQGAAVQAALIQDSKAVEDMVVTDVTPFSLGINISKQIGNEIRTGYFMPIINRNTGIPVSRVERICTLYPNQREVSVEVYQGESRRVKDNLLLGKVNVKNIPAGPAGQEVDVRFTYDLNGVLEVESNVVKTGKKEQLVITKLSKGMSDADVKKAISEMQALKVHPREDAANMLLLKRAERFVEEIPVGMRFQLEQLIDNFETALNSQDPQVVTEWYNLLKQFIDELDR